MLFEEEWFFIEAMFTTIDKVWNCAKTANGSWMQGGCNHSRADCASIAKKHIEGCQNSFL